MKATQVTDKQRVKMATMREQGATLAQIGKTVKLHPVTVCDELKSPHTLAILARIRLKAEDHAAKVYAAVLDSLARRLAESHKLKPSEAQELEAHAVSMLERGQPTMAELFPQAAAPAAAAAEGPQSMTFEELVLGFRRSTAPSQTHQPTNSPTVQSQAGAGLSHHSPGVTLEAQR